MRLGTQESRPIGTYVLTDKKIIKNLQNNV